MSVRDCIVALAAIGAFVFLVVRGAECSRASDLEHHQRQVECIKRGIYCGESWR